MTDLAQRAVANTEHCEVRKIAYRQSKDGMVVSFVIHPNEVPKRLATAAIGSRYLLTVTELDDQDEPKEVMPAGLSKSEVETEARQSPPETPAGEPHKKSWDEILPSQQAGILCCDEKFWMFLSERSGRAINDIVDAATWVRNHCGVNTRANITVQKPAAMAKWRELVIDFRLWSKAVV